MKPDQVRHIFLDPPSKAYYEDKLFDHSNPVLNRDDTLAPFIRLRDALASSNVEMHTADRLLELDSAPGFSEYYSFGILDNYARLQAMGKVRLCAFVVFEPPVVDPRLYKALPELTAAFERVYVHNIHGDGYSLDGVDQSRLRKLYWPQPRRDVLASYWENENRLHRMVMINGNHKPASKNQELYGMRIEALVELAETGVVDLYGRGWERWWSRSSMWLPYWRNRRTLMSIYQGACSSKYEVLSRYEFALCFENMAMDGYVTEKIFDCFYAGAVPLYLGARDIADLIPASAYIDCRKYGNWQEMWRDIDGMSHVQIKEMKEAGREFLQGELFSDYYHALHSIVV